MITDYKAGVDVTGGGMTGDEFAWAVCHREGDRIVVDLVAARGRRGRQPFDLDAAVAACAQDLIRYGCRRVLGDRYAGAWPIAAFGRHGVTYEHSRQPKSELYLALQPLLTMGRLELPPDPETIKQAKLLERRRGAQGKDVVDHPVGAHDDRINSIALAISGLPSYALTDLLILVGGERATHREHLEGQHGPVLVPSEERSIQRWLDAVTSPTGAGTSGHPGGVRGLII